MTFLPYHTLPMFTTLLSILPDIIPQEYKFLLPYIRSLVAVPRHVIVQTAINNISLASTLNTYVLRVSQLRHNHTALIAFWAGVMTEAVGGMMDNARSGRRGVQMGNEQDIILRLLPVLNQGLAMKKVADLRIGCYMILAVVASKGALDDKLLTAMMEAVVLGWTRETTGPGLVCLSVLAQYRTVKSTPKTVTRELLKVPNLSHVLVELSKQRRIERLARSLCIALVDRLRKDGEIRGLPVIQQVIETRMISDPQIKDLIKALIVVADNFDDSTDAQRAAKPHLASTLASLTQITGDLAIAVNDALKESGVDMDQLEMKLHTTIRPAAILDASEDVEMEEVEATPTQSSPDFESLLQQLPKRTVNESSFLTHDASHVYPELCRAFLVATTNSANLTAFEEAPILRRASTSEDTLYLTFCMKTWSGPHPVIARASALQMATRCLATLKDGSVDFQAILPYAVSALSDAAIKVRRAAAKLLLALNQSYPSGADAKKKAKQMRKWASKGIYGVNGVNDMAELSTENSARFLSESLVPALEECVLDSKHIEAVFLKSLNGSKGTETTTKQDLVKLPKATRASVLSFFASHVLNSPIYLVRLRLLGCLNQVRSVGDISRTKLLLPVLQQWASLSAEKAHQLCQAEQIDVSAYDFQVLSIITANDSDGLEILTKIMSGTADRSDLATQAYKRARILWPSLKAATQLDMAQTLLDLSQGVGTGEAIVLESSAELLRTIPLSTDILSHLLDDLPTTAQLVDKAPTTKRRRTSHGEIARSVQDPEQLAAAIRRVTFVLQLVESSEPAEHPELLRGLFTALAELQQFKVQLSSELAYLQNLVLSSLLAIMNTYKSNPKTKLDGSAVRADLLVDCVQKTASPQVQNAALLLIASLAHTAPELVLNSVMPIFTFMGSSVLRQNDEYSAHVITQTVREVIPPLITSLRKNNGNPVTGASDLLLSFVAAYEHVPVHRRKGLFVSLVQTLGGDDFLFALLAMLADKYGAEKIAAFAADLSGSFQVELQLHSVSKYLDLVDDILKPRPTYTTLLLGVNDDTKMDPSEMAYNELSLLPHILTQKRLVSQTAKVLGSDDMDSARVRDLYSQLLEKVLLLSDMVKGQQPLQGACGHVFESLLALLSTSEFVKSVESLLDRCNESLRRMILKSLEVRIDKENMADTSSRTAMLNFLPQLTSIIRESSDVMYKHTAIACVDKISERYGKKDLEAVAAAAETIASEACLGQTDARLRVMALLCLASLVDILREGIMSILPVAMPKALAYMEASVSGTSIEAEKLHNAGYAFISALFQHVPYMVSGGYLDKLLHISNLSAEEDYNDDTNESRYQCLQLAAKQVDAKTMFGALNKNWEVVIGTGPLVRQFRHFLSIMLTIPGTA